MICNIQTVAGAVSVVLRRVQHCVDRSYQLCVLTKCDRRNLCALKQSCAGARTHTRTRTMYKGFDRMRIGLKCEASLATVNEWLPVPTGRQKMQWTLFIPGYVRFRYTGTGPTAGHYLSSLQTSIQTNLQRGRPPLIGCLWQYAKRALQPKTPSSTLS